MKRVRVTASGHVQGVFFRAETSGEAERRALTGWVRNTGDGRVQAEFQGDDDAVDAAVAFCRRGPGQARVDHLEVEPRAPVDGERGFDVR